MNDTPDSPENPTPAEGPSSTACLPDPDSWEIESGFSHLVRTVFRGWKYALLGMLIGAGACVAYALLATPVYRAEASIAPPDDQQKMGLASAALSAFGGVGAELAGSLGISVGGSDANRLEALLKSHRLVEAVVAKHDLLPVLFWKKWDKRKKAWNVDDPADVPDIWDADKFFDDNLTVNNDIKTSILTLKFECNDPRTATDVLGYLLRETALLIQQDELQKAEANKRFALDQLRHAADPIVVAKLQTLLSDQVEKAMMAHNVDHLAYDLLDPPAASRKKVRPKGAVVAALGGTGSLFLGCLLAYLVESVGAARRARPTRN